MRNLILLNCWFADTGHVSVQLTVDKEEEGKEQKQEQEEFESDQ